MVQTLLKPLQNTFKLVASQDVTQEDKGNTGTCFQPPALVAEWLTLGLRKQQVDGSNPAEATSEHF